MLIKIVHRGKKQLRFLPARSATPDALRFAGMVVQVLRLAAIDAAMARLKERQRQSDAQRGRTPDDERKPKDKDGKHKGGKTYQRDFGVPAPKARTA